jgi:hypothetical protein
MSFHAVNGILLIHFETFGKTGFLLFKEQLTDRSPEELAILTRGGHRPPTEE